MSDDQIPVDQSADPEDEVGPVLRRYTLPDDKKLSWGRRTEAQKITLRWLVAALSVGASIYLLYLFGRFMRAMLHVAKQVGHNETFWLFDWHLVFLGSLMVIPATAIILVLAKHSFSDEENKSASLKDIPLAQLIEALIDGVKGIFKKD